MDWNKGLTAEYYATIVDPITWRDIERFEIVSGKISHVESSLRESADLECTDFDTTKEQWIRIWFNARQGSSSEHLPLFTGLATSPDINIYGTTKTFPIQCFSSLKPAEDIPLPRGWFAPAGSDGAKVLGDLLSVTRAPKIAGEHPTTLQQAIIAEDNESHLSMAEKVLLAMDWRMWIDGYGRINFDQKSTEPAFRFDAAFYDSIEPELSVSDDWYSCPNVFRAEMDNASATVRDDDTASILSTVSRGREVWMTETGVTLSGGETLEMYAWRRLKEEQSHAFVVEYSRRFQPDLHVSDMIYLNYPAQGVVGNYIINTQDIELGYGARVSEQVTRV